MNHKKTTSILTLLLLTFLLIGCSNEGTETTNTKVETNLNISLSALYASKSTGNRAISRAVSNASTKILTGELEALNHTTSTTEIFTWSAYLDESNLNVTSNKTLSLVPGDYTFSLLLSDTNKQYVGTSVLEVLDDGTQNSIALTVSPVIGDTIFNVSVVSDLAGYRFQYATNELTSLTNPQVGVSIDGEAQDIFTINPVTGLSQAYLNLIDGTYNAHLSFYDGNIQVGRSVPAQENITVIAGEPLSIDIIALHTEAEFLIDIADSNATVKAIISQEIIDEITLANLEVVMQLSDGNTTYESLMTLSLESNQTVGTTIVPNMQFGTYAFELTFNDTSEPSVPVGTCLMENVVLDTNGSTINCEITLQRRSVIGGNLLAVVGVNVFNTNNEPIAGALVYVNDVLIGLTDSDTFGTAGYLKTYQVAGNTMFKAEDSNMTGETNTTLDPLGVSNVDVVLDTLIIPVINTAPSLASGKPWKYDFEATGDALTWENMGNLLPTRLTDSGVAVIGDYVYLFGGNVYGAQNNIIYKAPISNPTAWVDTNATIPGDIMDTKPIIIGDYIYLLGYNSNTIYRAPIADPTSWIDINAVLPNYISDVEIAVIGDFVYLFGRNGSHNNIIYKAPITDLTSWTDTGATLPTLLYDSQTAVIGDYIYIFGGATIGGISNVVYKAPLTNPTEWVNTNGSLPDGLCYSQVAVIGDYVYLFGGLNSNYNKIDKIYRAPITNPTSWVDTGAVLPTVLIRSQIAIIGDHVYLFGGEDNYGSIYRVYRSYIK